MKFWKDKDFYVREEKGVRSIHWGPGGVDFLIIPLTTLQNTEMGAGGGAGPTGVDFEAKYGKEWRGMSLAVVTHSGVTQPVETWRAQFEQVLKEQGIPTKIATVVDSKVFVSGQVGVGLSGSATPYAKDHEWRCEVCGQTIPPNHPHVH